MIKCRFQILQDGVVIEESEWEQKINSDGVNSYVNFGDHGMVTRAWPCDEDGHPLPIELDMRDR